MPDGIRHFQIGVFAGGAAVLGAAAYADLPTARAVAIGSLIGLLITPDLDQEGSTFTEHVLRRVPLVGYLFQVSWYGYALLFRHRGWSHHIIIGTPTRILWSLLLLAFWACTAVGLATLWAGASLQVAARDWLPAAGELLLHVANVTAGDALAVLLAWWLQDLWHILADAL